MKKTAVFLLAGGLCAFLAGCAQAVPEKAADGSAWDEAWVTVGGVIGVDTPGGMDARENNSALAASGMYYATWSVGEAEAYTNADGGEAEIYDAQVYLLLAGYDTVEKAEESMEQWLEMANSRYDVGDTAARSYNGQDFTVLTYTYASGPNPYERGVSAFGVYGNYAVSAELSCRGSGDAGALLNEFLENCHYAA